MNTFTWIIIVLVVIIAIFILWKLFKGGSSENVAEKKETKDIKDIIGTKVTGHVVTLNTNFGEIKFEMYDADAPKTVKNFITLTEKGFYNNLTFHRVVKGFVIQGGDPSGNGTGGPGYAFEDELNPATESYKNGYKKGVVAMANAAPNTNGSQFFIMLADNPLPHNYTIFGKIITGEDVVDKIGQVAMVPQNRPLEAAIMKKVAVEGGN